VNGPAGSILPGPFIVLDVQVRAQGTIANPAELQAQLANIPGVVATTPFAAEVNALDAVDYERMMHTVMRHLGRSADLDATVDIPARTWTGTAVHG